MDLQTEPKLNQGVYSSAVEFYNDVKLIWMNSMTYNRDGSEYFVAAEKMDKLWEREFSKKFDRDTSLKFSYETEETSQNCDSNSVCLSPPNLVSPRFGMDNTQESGAASLTNVIRFVETQKDLLTGDCANDSVEVLEKEEFKSKQILSNHKRKRVPTPKSSPSRPKKQNLKRVRFESIQKLITNEAGTVSLESFLALRLINYES